MANQSARISRLVIWLAVGVFGLWQVVNHVAVMRLPMVWQHVLSGVAEIAVALVLAWVAQSAVLERERAVQRAVRLARIVAEAITIRTQAKELGDSARAVRNLAASHVPEQAREQIDHLVASADRLEQTLASLEQTVRPHLPTE